MFLKVIIIIIGSFFTLLSLTSSLDRFGEFLYLGISLSIIIIGFLTKKNNDISNNDFSRLLILSGVGLLVFAVIMAFRSLLMGDINVAKLYSEIWLLGGFGVLFLNFVIQIIKKDYKDNITK